MKRAENAAELYIVTNVRGNVVVYKYATHVRTRVQVRRRMKIYILIKKSARKLQYPPPYRCRAAPY